MRYRKKMTKQRSRKSFTRGAMKVKRKNFATPMRGGYRL
jgi:hypothetical protein